VFHYFFRTQFYNDSLYNEVRYVQHIYFSSTLSSEIHMAKNKLIKFPSV